MKYGRKSLPLLVAWGLLAIQANFAQTTSEPPQAAQQSKEQLQQLVAPIALYPDPLLAQVLAHGHAGLAGAHNKRIN